MNSAQTWRESNHRRIIMDNGAQTIKCSLASDSKPHVCLNAVGRNKRTGKTFIGNKLRDEQDKGGEHQIAVTYPIIRGLLHDSDLESVIWKQEFARFGKKFDERVSCLVLTVPPVIPDVVQERLAEVVFEDFEFDAYS